MKSIMIQHIYIKVSRIGFVLYKLFPLNLFLFVSFFTLTLRLETFQAEVSAESGILLNADTGHILFAKNPYTPLYPASTTKIATLLFIVAEKQPHLHQKMEVSAESLRMKPAEGIGGFPPYWWDVDGSRMGLKVGEIVSLESLLHGLMLVSGNDAANVLAERLSGSIPVFMQELNVFLRKIGCQQTSFFNPHGSYYPEHRSTAYDLSLITREALRFPLFREIISKRSFMKEKTNKQDAIELQHTNQLLQPGRFYYPKAIGGKTGFHSQGKYCLVAVAAHEKRTLIAVLLGSPNKSDRYSDAIRLFETAFEEKEETRKLFDTKHQFTKKLLTTKNELTAILSQDVSITYFPSEEPTCRAFIEWTPPPLPIRKGQTVGEMRISDEKGLLIAKEKLIAKENVDGTFMFLLKQAFSFLRS